MNSELNNFHGAIRVGDLDRVQEFFPKDSNDINAPGDGGYTALHWAVQGNHVNVVEYLISRGANVEAEDQFGETPVEKTDNREVIMIIRDTIDQQKSKEEHDIKEERVIHQEEYKVNIAFDVIFEGKPIEGKNIEEVKKNITTLFKITDKKTISRLFSGNSIIIKKNVNSETADRYVNAIIRAGAECRKNKSEKCIPRLEELAFTLTKSGVALPAGKVFDGQKQFHSRLVEGRRNAVEFRKEWKRNSERQFEEQGFGGISAVLFNDPVDQILPGWHSIAIIYDWDKMDTNYAEQVFKAFFKQVEPGYLTSDVVLHFGDMVKFETFCALNVRSKSLRDLEYIAGKYGINFKAVGLLPHGMRFLMSESTDGNLIARTFSLPTSAVLKQGKVYPDSQTGLDSVLEVAVANTQWGI